MAAGITLFEALKAADTLAAAGVKVFVYLVVSVNVRKETLVYLSSMVVGRAFTAKTGARYGSVHSETSRLGSRERSCCCLWRPRGHC